MRAGQAQEDKEAFYARAAKLLKQDPGILPENLMIVITENGKEDWSFRDGIAQFIAND